MNESRSAFALALDKARKEFERDIKQATAKFNEAVTEAHATLPPANESDWDVHDIMSSLFELQRAGKAHLGMPGARLIGTPAQKRSALAGAIVRAGEVIKRRIYGAER